MEEKAAEYAGELAALEGLVADLGPLAGLLPERVGRNRTSTCSSS